MTSTLDQISNCVRCGKLYVRVASALCPECVKKERIDLEKVKDYLRSHRGASMEETVEDTATSASRIIAWIQAGHLMLGPESAIQYPCENGCGTLIRQGKYCTKCLREISSALTLESSDTRNRGHGFYSKLDS